MAFTRVDWDYKLFGLTFTLSNGESSKTGKFLLPPQSYTFDAKKKITKVEVLIRDNPRHNLYIAPHSIYRINFYSGQETLIKVGMDDSRVQEYGGRVETFEITSDEQLIGCQFNHSENGCFMGVRWLKMKVRF